MELSFCDLRAKEVVNICNGQKLGNVVDIIIDCNCARVVGIVVPYDKGFFNFFKNNQDIFIPWHKICKIGKDVILVELTPINMPIACATPMGNEKISSATYNQEFYDSQNKQNMSQNSFYGQNN